MLRATVVCLALAAVFACTRPSPERVPGPGPASASTTARARPPRSALPEPRVPDGINDRWVSATPADAEKTLEREGREVYAAREAVLEALRLTPGARVADIGAGTGFFVKMFADAVGPGGHVYGVEISPALVDGLRAWAKMKEKTHVEAVLGGTDDVRLPPASIDVAFMSDTYHHLEAPMALLRSLARALRPEGRVFILDFERIPGTSDPWILGHVRAGKAKVREEVERAGFPFVREIDVDGLEDNYLLEFGAPK